MKRQLKLFMIHQWSMSELQTKIHNLLFSNNLVVIEDFSITKDNPIEGHLAEFAIDYACGKMMDSDIVLILPDSPENEPFEYIQDSLKVLGQPSFRVSRGLLSSSVYTEELQALLFDSCNTKPVLVIGWTKGSAEYLAKLLNESSEEESNGTQRFFSIGQDEISNNKILLNKILSILDKNNRMNAVLWNEGNNINVYKKNPKLYKEPILEQYKLYVEMADRVSSRRNLANVFFLTLNTTMLGVIGFAFESFQLVTPKWFIVFPIIGLLLMNLIWHQLVCSYRNINTAKYAVLRELSLKLPASPWTLEWIELGEGRDKKKHLPLTKLEVYIPLIFGMLYVFVGIFVIFIMY